MKSLLQNKNKDVIFVADIFTLKQESARLLETLSKTKIKMNVSLATFDNFSAIVGPIFGQRKRGYQAFLDGKAEEEKSTKKVTR